MKMNFEYFQMGVCIPRPLAPIPSALGPKVLQA